jgi:pyruvate dehydrogenase E1 component beta subunit
MPSNPYDAKGLLKSAIRGDNPVIFIEERSLYEMKGPVPEEEYFVPIGKAEIKREGTDVTIVSYSRCLHEGLRAAEVLEADGISSEVIDLRTVKPLDKETIKNSVRKTGRLVIVHDACKTGGLGAEIAALVAEEALEWLEAPIRRVAALDTIMTFNQKLEKYIQPDKDKIVAAVREVIRWTG